jgi:hypothetical protein
LLTPAQTRMQECVYRRPKSCSLIDHELGWQHGISEQTCDECWHSPTDHLSGEVRSKVVLTVKGQLLKEDGTVLTGASMEVLDALVLKHKAEPYKMLQVAMARWGPEVGKKLADKWSYTAKLPDVPSIETAVSTPNDRWQTVRESWEQATSFFKSQLSAGLTSKKVALTVKNQRHISCTGRNLEGEFVADPCPALAKGKVGLYCNECGCGDRDVARLTGEGYTKLDYPYLECPRKRAGFSNSKLRGYDLEHMVKRVVLLNLDRRLDRWNEVMGQFAQDWPFRKPVRWRAIDGQKCPTPYEWRSGGGAWGCMQSHRQILEQCLLDGVDSILVLEDDALLMPNFREDLTAFMTEVPPDWECLMLGGQHMKAPIPVSERVVRCTNTQRTHAYILRGSIIRDLYREWVSRKGHCDHSMGPFCADRRTYAPTRFLIAQKGGSSDISGRVDKVRSWDAPQDKALVYVAIRATSQEVTAMRQAYHFGYTLDERGVDVGLNGIFADQKFDSDKLTRGWLPMLQWEAESLRRPVMIWHPEAEKWLLELQKALGNRLVVVHGSVEVTDGCESQVGS